VCEYSPPIGDRFVACQANKALRACRRRHTNVWRRGAGGNLAQAGGAPQPAAPAVARPPTLRLSPSQPGLVLGATREGTRQHMVSSMSPAGRKCFHLPAPPSMKRVVHAESELWEKAAAHAQRSLTFKELGTSGEGSSRCCLVGPDRVGDSIWKEMERCLAPSGWGIF